MSICSLLIYHTLVSGFLEDAKLADILITTSDVDFVDYESLHSLITESKDLSWLDGLHVL